MGNNEEKCYIIPFIERLLPGVVLQAALINQKLHSFKERRCDSWRLFSKQNINRFG